MQYPREIAPTHQQYNQFLIPAIKMPSRSLKRGNKLSVHQDIDKANA